MTRNGSLGSEIQRKTAEIDSWPAWAKPYKPPPPPTPAVRGSTPAPATTHEDPGGSHAAQGQER
jgi:hypothetical protein